MYHNSSTTYMTVLNNHSLPSPEYTGDSDSDSEIIKELEQKRRQLDEDIARFRAQKDKEFKDFEYELKSKRRQRRTQQHFHGKSGISHYEFTKHSPSTTPPSRPVLTGCEKKTRSPSRQSGFRQIEPIRLTKANAGPKATPPTICLDKMNISSENLQSHVSPLQTPPTPTTISSLMQVGRTQNHASPSSTYSAPSQMELTRDTSSVLTNHGAHEETSSFAGLFVPSYLSSLDVGHDANEGQVEGTQTVPATPTEPSMINSVAVHASSLPTESSLSEAFQVPQTKRSYTSPSAINRAKLPPIIRNVNGRTRASGKRKHVTFQLADRAIVEPSSSYEEGASPDIDNDSVGRKDSGDSTGSGSSHENTEVDAPRPRIQRKITPLDPFGRRKRIVTPTETPDEEVGMSMGDLLASSEKDDEITTTKNESAELPDGYFSPKHSIQSPTSPSPERSTSFGSVDDNAYMHKRKEVLTTQKLERRNSKSPNTSPSVSRQPSFEVSDDKSGQKTSIKPDHLLRFSPHQSPATRPMQGRYPGMIEDDLLLGNGNIGFFELDEELDDPEAGKPRPDLPDDKDEDLEMSRTRMHRKTTLSDEIQTGTSVPIDIIRPGTSSVTNSWVGTFGH